MSKRCTQNLCVAPTHEQPWAQACIPGWVQCTKRSPLCTISESKIITAAVLVADLQRVNATLCKLCGHIFQVYTHSKSKYTHNPNLHHAVRILDTAAVNDLYLVSGMPSVLLIDTKERAQARANHTKKDAIFAGAERNIKDRKEKAPVVVCTDLDR